MTTTTYDAENEAISVQRPDGSTLSYAYGCDGHQVGQTDGSGRTTTYAYDPLGRLASVSDPLGRRHSYDYDGAGRLVASIDASGQTTSYAHDAGGELTGITYSGGTTSTVTYAYDADGRRTQMLDGTGTSSYTWDSLGRLVAVTTGAGSHVGYGYDLAAKLLTLDYPATASVAASLNGTTTGGAAIVTRTYDRAGRMASVSDWLGHTTSFSYDADSNLVGIAYPNSTSAASSFDAADQVTHTTDTGPAGTFLDLAYTYDSASRVSTANATGTSAGPTETYGYDPASRLSAVTVPAPTASSTTGTQAHSYAYDLAGDLTQIATPTLTQNLAYDAAQELTSITNPATGSATALSYNPEGDRLSQASASASTTYTWNQANQLVGFAGAPVSAVNGQAGTDVRLSYSYNGDGLRSDLVYDQVEGLPLVISSSTASFITGPRGLVVEQVSATGSPIYYHGDAQGSTRALTDSGGQLLSTYSYDPYGNALSSGTAEANPFLWQGQYQDPQSGLYYLRARWYDPATGQFLSVDPLEALTQEPYGYVNDNPLNFTDPTGLYPGEDWVHKAEHAVKSAVHTGLDVVATLPYGVYYVTYYAADAMNDVGCSSAFGSVQPVTCAASHVAAALLAIPETIGLGGDVAIDQLKIDLGLVPPSYTTCDEGQNINLFPRQFFHGGPTVHNVPGVRKNGGIDFEW